jgi:iron complex outermembrane receptor protein
MSSAIRSPTPFDDDVVEKLGSLVYLTGNPDFQSEKVSAYEIGARAQPTPQMSISVSGFYNYYNDLRTIELGPNIIPLRWGNGLKGRTYGVEIWGDYQLTPWWRLSAAFDELLENFDFKPGASGVLGVSQLGDDPENSASLRSAISLGSDVSLNADLRYVGALPDPHVPSYVEFNTGIAWDFSQTLRLSLSGFNLLHARHQEFPSSEANAVPRSFSVGVQWRF